MNEFLQWLFVLAAVVGGLFGWLHRSYLQGEVERLDTQNRDLKGKVERLDTQKRELKGKVEYLDAQNRGLSSKFDRLLQDANVIVRRIRVLESSPTAANNIENSIRTLTNSANWCTDRITEIRNQLQMIFERFDEEENEPTDRSK